MSGPNRSVGGGQEALAEVVELVPSTLGAEHQELFDLLVDAVVRHLDQLDRTATELVRSGADGPRWRAVLARSAALREVTVDAAEPEELSRQVRRLRALTGALFDVVGPAVPDGPSGAVVADPRPVRFARAFDLLEHQAFPPGRLPTRWSSEAAHRTVALLSAKVATFTPTVAGSLPSPDLARAVLALGLPDAPEQMSPRPTATVPADGVMVQRVVELLSRDVSIGGAVRSLVESASAGREPAHLLDLATALYVEGRTSFALAVLDLVPTSLGHQRRTSVRRLRALWAAELGRTTEAGQALLDLLDHLDAEDSPVAPLVAAEATAVLDRAGRPGPSSANPLPTSPVDIRSALLGLDASDVEVLSCAARPLLARGESARVLGAAATAALSGRRPDEVRSTVQRVGEELLAGPTTASSAGSLPLVAAGGSVSFEASAPGPPVEAGSPAGPDGGPDLAAVVAAAVACGVDLDRPPVDGADRSDGLRTVPSPADPAG